MRFTLRTAAPFLLLIVFLIRTGQRTLYAQILNGSFESGLSGWTALGSVTVSGPPGQVSVGVDGSRVATLGSFDQSGAILSQTAGVIAGTNYVLSFATAANGTPGLTGVL